MILCEKRNGLLRYLKKNNIEAKIHYPIPLHLQPALKKLGYKLGHFKNAEKIASEVLSFP